MAKKSLLIALVALEVCSLVSLVTLGNTYSAFHTPRCNAEIDRQFTFIGLACNHILKPASNRQSVEWTTSFLGWQQARESLGSSKGSAVKLINACWKTCSDVMGFFKNNT
ncbi:hypothetical protein F4604DRAFT_1688683 [Suillus subluteus]|nr:hypothetical protein F4604DRAFT_1688683 [Suillus subluteus]